MAFRQMHLLSINKCSRRNSMYHHMVVVVVNSFIHSSTPCDVGRGHYLLISYEAMTIKIKNTMFAEYVCIIVCLSVIIIV